MFSKNALIVPSLGNGEICIRYVYMKLMVVHYASRFMQRISKKRTRLQFHHTNYVCFDAYKANMSILPVFLIGNSHAYMLVPQQVTHRT